MDDSGERENSESSAVEGWTKVEKYYLFLALKTYGSHDIEKLQECCTTKTVAEVQAAVDYYKQRALNHPRIETEEVESKKRKRPNRAPLASWAKFLTDTMSFDELRTETSTAVQMIAGLERHPEPVATAGYDFRAAYQQIANAMEGKPLGKNKMTGVLLEKCVVETALASKAFMRNSACKLLIDSIDTADLEASKDITPFPRPSDNQELYILRHLAVQKKYNPLKIPEEYLKPTSATVYNFRCQYD